MHDKAETGLFLTLTDQGSLSPEAVAAARQQLLTIESLLADTALSEPLDYEPDLNLKNATAEANSEQAELL